MKGMFAMRAIVLLIIAELCAFTYASHYRYGSISWTSNGGNSVTFNVNIWFRYSYFTQNGYPATLGATYVNNQYSSLFLNYGDDANNYAYYIPTTVAAIDTANDLINFQSTVTHQYASAKNPNGQPWTVGYYSNARILSLLNNAGKNWALTTYVDANIAASPVAQVLPIVPVNSNPAGIATFQVQASGTGLKFRLATQFETCQTTNDADCKQPPGLSIDINTGVISWNTNGLAQGLYSAVIMIYTDGGIAVPVDFIITFAYLNGQCSSSCSNSGSTCTYNSQCGGCDSGCIVAALAPVFINPTPASGSTITVPMNSAVSITIKASSTSSNIASISSASLPSGSNLAALSGTNPASRLFTWTSPNIPNKSTLLCFNAVGSNGVSSGQQCFTILTGNLVCSGSGQAYCATCSLTATNCLSCTDGRGLSGNTCPASCPIGYYNNNGVCTYSPATISHIPSFNTSTCSPAITITGGGNTLSFGTFRISGCTVYSDSVCSESSQITGSTPQTQAGTVVYLKCTQANYYQKFSANSMWSNVFQIIGHDNGGNICGDPHFVGYDGREFLFDGIIGDYYNIYSDPYLNVNSLLKDAKNANPYVNSSVNGAMALRTADFNITLNPDHYDDDKKSIMFEFNGQRMWIKEDEKMPMQGDCVVISFEKDVNTRHHHHTFEVITEKFRVIAYVSLDSNKYINTAYLDYFIGIDQSNPSLIGGIIGETAGTYDPEEIEDHPDRFHVSSALEAGSKFRGEHVCKVAQKTIEKRKTIIVDQPNCRTVPDGFLCYKHRTCASGYCGRTHVCQPWNGCLATVDCPSTQTCVDGACA